MKIFCTESFKHQFDKLVRNQSYASLQSQLIEYFFNDEMDKRGGTKLNGHAIDPFIKKRLDGAGGYRAYYYIVIKNDCLYLAFVHPKTGKYGMSNISDQFKRALAKEVLDAIKMGKLYDMRLNTDRQVISFTSVIEK